MDDQITRRISECTAELKRKSVVMSEHLTTNDKEVIDMYESKMESNIGKVMTSNNKVESVALKHRSVGWFDLMFIILAVFIINYIMSIFMNIFHK
ncbi:Uncharacterized protein QTN25_009965 [Entamoeba marina]